MVLQLHVWGPGFGLPSLDAECLAAIAYLAETTSPADYQLVRSSPSAVPTHHLPALYDPSSAGGAPTWASGLAQIAAHLRAHPPPGFSDPDSGSPPAAAAAADGAAYAAFLTAHAAPLLALSLYVSSANYRGATRPALSRALPMPLPWTEPPAARAAMARRAAHLGMSALDTESAAAASSGERRIREEDGWIAVPAAGMAKKGGGGGGGGGSVKEALGPEERARIRLEALAADVLDVLRDVDWERQTAAARCLAFGYLALMLVPEVPRPWLREVMERRYRGLCQFVRRFRRDVLADGKAALPWAEGAAGGSVAAVAARFLRGVMAEVPVVGGLWSRWWAARTKRRALARKGIKTGSSGDALVLVGSGLAMLAAGAGVFFYRSLPPFGAEVQVWRKPVVALSSFGAAGALLSGALYGVD